MFGLFKSDPLKKLTKKYDRLMEEAYSMSHTNRKLSDQKYAEADAIMNEIEKLKAASKN